MMNKIDRHGHVLVFDKEEEIADFLIGRWEEISQKTIGPQGMFCVALSGGKTSVLFLLDREAGSRLTNNVLLSPKNMCCRAAVKKVLL